MARTKLRTVSINSNDLIAEELKIICRDNDLPDLSANTESLLTYTLFSNTAVNFFKERNF